MKTWLFLDVNFLAHRAFYSTGDLTYREIKTGVIYGVLRDILNLQQLHYTNRLAFCFDSKSSKRKELSGEYKANRAAKYAAMTKSEKRTWEEFRSQIQLMRREYLPSLGYQNIFCQKGYEADDLIAMLCDSLEPNHRAIVVSADGDLLQCLSDRVSIWNPRTNKMVTSKSFRAEYGIHPVQWSQVKAIAGCKSDNVAGVKGIGEKTACKWVRGLLKPKDRTYQLISNSLDIHNRNIQLTRLPFPGTKPMELVRDKFDQKAWKELTKRFGLKSLEGR